MPFCIRPSRPAPYRYAVVDLYLPLRRLAVEIDRPHHRTAKQRAKDARRDALLLRHHPDSIVAIHRLSTEDLEAGRMETLEDALQSTTLCNRMYYP